MDGERTKQAGKPPDHAAPAGWPIGEYVGVGRPCFNHFTCDNCALNFFILIYFIYDP